MSIKCRLFGHSPNEPGVFNTGLYFTRCGACDAELIRQQGGRWLPVPPGFRVEWKPEGHHSIAPWQATNIAHQWRWRR